MAQPVVLPTLTGEAINTSIVGAWTFWEGSNSADSLVDGADDIELQGSGGWNTRAAGTGIESNAANSGGRLASPSSDLKTGSSKTIFTYGSHGGDGGSDLTGSPALATMWYDVGGGTPFVSYGICRSSVSATALRYFWNQAGTFREIASTVFGGYSANTPYSAALTIESGAAKAYFNGAQTGATNTNASTINYGATPTFDIGRHVSATGNPDALLTAVYVWNRVLTVDEIAALHADPWLPVNGAAVAGTKRSFAVWIGD